MAVASVALAPIQPAAAGMPSTALAGFVGGLAGAADHGRSAAVGTRPLARLTRSAPCSGAEIS